MSDFKDLLQEAEKLTTDIEGATPLPKVDRSLKQVLEASKELYTRVAQTGGKDIQANLLLGSKGVDLPKIAQKLEKVSGAKAFQPVASLDAYDVKAFLTDQRRNIITSVLEEDLRYCYNSLYEQCFDHMRSDWKQEKRKIISAMTAPSGAFIAIEHPKNIYIEPPSIDVTLGPEETIYAAKVHEYNAAAGRSLQKINLVQVFATAAQEFKDTKVSDMWEMLKYMTEVPPFPVGEDFVETRYSKPFVTAFVRQGTKYLEDRYKKYMSNIINENLGNAMLGGVPGTYNLVKSFVGVRLQGDYMGLQDGMIDGRPLWPMVYYCLRSGDINAALYCISTSNCADCQDLIAALESKYKNPDHADNVKLESTVRFQYRRFIRNSTDPFKRIVWCVVGCCDTIDEHSEVARTADDYLWLKLCLVRVDYDKDDHIKYEELQRTIVDEYGESHYDALNHPHLYFQMLILTSQFESAVEFLTRIARYNVHAVHMGIALHEMYMLLGPRDVSTPLLFVDPMDPKPVRRFNFARSVMLYVSKFEVTCISEAIQYYFLLRNMQVVDGTNLFLLCVTDLIQETGAYEKVLGKVERNGLRTKGLIDNLNNMPVTAEVIAKTTADKFVQKGMFEQAVNLYDIANEQNEVLGLLCTLLSQVVQTPPQPNSLRERLRQKSEDIAERYGREGYRCAGELGTSFRILRILLDFFDYYHIPLQTSDLEDCVSNFKKYNVEVWSVFPDLLLAVMNILFDQYQKIRGKEFIPQRYQDSSVDKQLEHLRNQAKVVSNFAGTIPFRLPGDTSSKLMQMEILMH